MKNYVISLKSAKKRRDHIETEFKKFNIDYSFFDAITPLQNEKICLDLGIDIKKFTITKTEISCFLSHIYIWKKALQDNTDYISVFEDDIYLGEQAFLFLGNTNWIPSNIDIVKIESFDKSIEVLKTEKIKTLDNRFLYKLISKHIGGAGYIISKKAIIYLLSELKNKDEIEPIDLFIFEDMINNLNIYQMLPALCIQDFIKNNSYENFGSALEGERRIRFNIEKNIIKSNYNFLSKIKREILRIFKQLYKLMRKIKYEKKVTYR